MTTSVRAFVLALAVAVIAGVLIGTVTSSDEAGAATQRTLRIPAAAFAAANQYSLYNNQGYRLSNQGATWFVAPVFLEGNTVTIHSVRLHYLDNGPGRICVTMQRSNLKSGGLKTMSELCTRNAVADVRTKIDTTINPDTIGPDAAAFLYLSLSNGGSSYQYYLYGVTIVYTSDL